MNFIRGNPSLETVDWAVILAYLLGIVALGVWFGKDQRNTRDYFLGGKSIPWWGVGLSIVATETSALTFIGVPALAYAGNLAFIQIIIGYVIARLILALLLVPHYFKGEIYSPYQLFANAFGPAARRTAAGFFLIAGTLAAGVRVYVTCIPIQLMLDLPIGAAIWLFVVLSLIYTVVGGIKAVVWTDAVQFLLFMGGGVFALCYIPLQFHGGFGTAFVNLASADKLDWFNPHFSLAMPYNIWMGLLGATFQVMSSHGVDQLIVQRVLTCNSMNDGRKSLVLSAVIIFPLFLIFLLTGSMLWFYYQQYPMPIPLPQARSGLSQDHYVFPIFILTAAPPALKGFLIVAILSAAMSSVSSALSALASVSTMDIFQATTGKARSEKFYLGFSKCSTLFWALMLVAVAYATREAQSILEVAFQLNGLTNGAMLGGLIFALVVRSGRAIAVILGMLASFFMMLGIHFLPKWTFSSAAWHRLVGFELAWPWYTLTGAIVTLAVAYFVRAALPRASDAARAR